MATTAPTVTDQRVRLVADAVIAAYLAEINVPRPRPVAPER